MDHIPKPVRRLVGLMLAWVLLCATSELHDGVLEPALRATETSVSVDARHAAQAAHFEASKLEARPSCPACTLDQQIHVAVRILRARGADPPIEQDFKPQHLQAPGRGSHALTSTRAPPLSRSVS